MIINYLHLFDSFSPPLVATVMLWQIKFNKKIPTVIGYRRENKRFVRLGSPTAIR
jgi:hypothetical protein